MSQSGFTPILIYASGTPSAVPSAGNLTSSASGAELALNYSDGKLFYKDSGGVVQVLAGKGGSGVVAGSNTQVQFNNSGVFGASSGLTWDGTNLTATQLRSSGLTSGRVTYASTSGLLVDSANLTFSGSNLGVGLTPSNWAQSKAVEVNAAGNALAGFGDSDTIVTSGVYHNTGWKYAATNSFGASYFEQIYGDHRFYAVAGSAHNAGDAATLTWVATINTQGLTLNAGTANGVAYLNGSKVVTTGSALTFDGSVLTNTSGAIRASGSIVPASGAGIELLYGASGAGIGTILSYNRSGSAYQPLWIDGSYLAYFVSGSEQMRLTSTGLGIGTSSPGVRLDVIAASQKIAKFFAQSSYGQLEVGTTGANQNVYLTLTPNGTGLGIIQHGTGDVMTFNSSGNLGLGVTPSAWGASYKGLQVGSGASIWSGASGFSGTYLNNNSYFNGTNRIYLQTGQATEYAQGSGQHIWYTAASGTAGNAISFTQAMTLFSSGSLGIGATSDLLPQRGNLTLEGATGSANGSVLGFAQSGSIIGGIGQAARILGTGTSQDIFIQSQGASNNIGMNANPSGAYIYFQTQGTERARIDSAGNFGLGVTPSAWSQGRAFEVLEKGYGVWNGTGSAYLLANAYFNSGFKYANTGAAASHYYQYQGAHVWSTAASGTAGNAISFTQAMTLDASGNLLVGRTSGVYRIDAAHASAGEIARFSYTGGSKSPYIAAIAQSDTLMFLDAQNSDNTVALGIRVSGAERARITSGGYFKASNDGTYYASTGSQHELRNTVNGNWTVRTVHVSATDPYGIEILYSAASPNGTGAPFLQCRDSGPTLRAEFRSNGGLANYQSNNVDLSDARTKKDITPAPSYWNKIGALEIVTYKYNDQTHDDVNVGVIAQQVEQVEPVWVDADGFGETPEDGVPLKTVYTKDITFAAIKALQEAMARIEKLEAEVAALKGA